ncbi:MAG: pilus assembly protein PilM [Planctomycetota bacterium]|jgi:Tfp pilus assembly PilM family ATPase
MPFGMFRSHYSPILADFGSSGVKLVQTTVGELPTVSAAAFVPFSDELRARPIEERFEFLARELPEVLRENHFRGSRLVLAPFSQHMLVQHIGVPAAEAERAESVIRLQIAIGLGCDPAALVVRTSEVCETTRDGTAKVEHIAFAMSRDDVMRYVELARRTKLNVVGVHGEISALVHAFDHVNRRAEDENISTMYVDLGYGGTKVAICHGAKLVFAKSISIAGRTIDTRLSEVRRCSLSDARAARLAEGIKPIRIGSPAPMNAVPAAAAAATAADGGMAILRAAAAKAEADNAVTMTASDRRGAGAAPALGSAVPAGTASNLTNEVRETVESLSDELSMCARYHATTFRDRRIDRVVFLGGEARDTGLCQSLASGLRLPAKVGDPMARFLINGAAPKGLPDAQGTHPGWAVACGLASSPTDL